MKTDNEHLIIEVRAAEGGDDAKTLVALQVAIYGRLAGRRSL
jgi:protein subunit release factor A